MTEQERAVLEELAEAATPGPWVDLSKHGAYGVVAVGDTSINEVCREPELDERAADMAFIAAARTAVPALLAENAALRAVLAEFTDGKPGGDIEPAIHYNHYGDWECNYCKAQHDNIAMIEHAPDCPVTRARALLREGA